jgi:hypothetical protein
VEVLPDTVDLRAELAGATGVGDAFAGESEAHRNFQRQFFPAAGYRPGSPSHERASLWRRSSLQRGSELRAERDDEFGEAA